MPDQEYELYKFKHLLTQLQTYIPGYEFLMSIDDIKNVFVIRMIRRSDGKDLTLELDRTQQYYSDEIIAECLWLVENLQGEET